MNKQDALKRIEIIEREAAMLRKIVETPEEPKLRHGDFGITTRKSIDDNKFIVIETLRGKLEPQYSDGKTDGCTYAEKNLSEYIILGNIFDLLKEWSEPFEHWHSKKGYNYDTYSDLTIVIRIDDYRRDKIWIGTCGNSAWYPRKDAEEIHNALGHAITELKRKENKNV